MPKRKVQNEDEAIRWIREGRSNLWLREKYRAKYGIETGSSMWSLFRMKRGLDAFNARNDDLIPWTVDSRHLGAYLLQMLRLEGRSRAGYPMSERSAKRLHSFRDNLAAANAVVYYEPESEQGFFYVPRLETDTDIVRMPPRKTKRNNARQNG